MTRKAAFRRKKINISGMLPVLLVLAMMFVALIISGNTLKSKVAAFDERITALDQEIEEQEAYAQELIEFKKYTQTKKYAEEVAKNKLGLVYSDEIVFRPEN